MKEHDLFFELVKIAVGRRDCFSRTPKEEEWNDLFNESVRQALIGVNYDALDRLPTEQHPPRKLLLKWHGATEQIADTNRRLNKEAVWACNKFRKAGFRNAVLKGQGNATLYPNPLRRQSGDIDIWLEGKRKDIIRYVRKIFPQEPIGWLEITFPVLPETIIEVHIVPSILFHPGDDKRLQKYYESQRENAFTNAIELPNEGMVNVPTWEMNVIFQLTHVYRHLFHEGIGMRQLMDYYYLLMHCPTEGILRENEQGKRIHQLTEQMHLMRFARALMWVLGEVFELDAAHMTEEPDEKEGRFLLDEVMLAGNFGKFDKRIQIKKSYWGNFWQITNRNWRFLTRYPREVLCNPLFRILQFVWRKANGSK